MIISRSPFRITLAGGGTDLPAYYSLHGGEVTSMAINKYIYVSFKKNILCDKVRLQYLKTEEVDNANQLSHDRAREVLREFGVLDKCEISSMADLPSKSGLGSSGSYLTALINCLQQYRGLTMTKYEIANLACKIEMENLNEPVGKQDQFISAHGGIKRLCIDKNGTVTVRNVEMAADDISSLTNRCAIYYTGVQRSASRVLKSQTRDKVNFEYQMKGIADLGQQSLEALTSSNFDKYGSLLHDHWTYKKMLSSSMTNNRLDKIYEYLKKSNLILGGKIIGAGGGGFMMLYVPSNIKKVDSYMLERGMPRISYSVDEYGVKTVHRAQDQNIPN